MLARYGADAHPVGAEASPLILPTDAESAAPPVTVDPACARCPGCGYVYDSALGDPREGFPAGTPWSAVPEDWSCPDCGVRDKSDFERIERTTA